MLPQHKTTPNFKNKAKNLFIALLLICWTAPTSASIELIPFAGINLKDGVTISVDMNNLLLATDVQTEGNTWIFGGDLLYRLQDHPSLGIGIRYQSYFIFDQILSAPFFILNYTINNEKFNTHRVAFLTNYRFFLDQTKDFFIGLVFAIDIFRYLKSEVYSAEIDRINITSSQWLGTGQAGLEIGFKVIPQLLIKTEFGYSLFAFTNPECNGVDCSNGVSQITPFLSSTGNFNLDLDTKINLSAFYGLLGIGLVF